MSSYASILKRDLSNTSQNLFQLISHGKSMELKAYLQQRKPRRALLNVLEKSPFDDQCLSLLMIAVLHGHDTVVREILLYSPDSRITVELEGRIQNVNGILVENATALWCALDRRYFSVATTLIEIGKANVNHGPQRPLLIDATINGRLDIVQFLVENSYVNINETKTNDENQSNCLIVASSHGHSQIIEYLLKKNVILELQNCKDGNTALAVAIIHGHLGCVRLLRMAGASSKVPNVDRKTPITLALENKNFDIINILIDSDPNNEIFEEIELFVALHILKHKGNKFNQDEWIVDLLKYSLCKRSQFDLYKVNAEPIEFYNFQQECQSINDINQIKNDAIRLHVEALLIIERILFSRKDEQLLESLFQHVFTLIDKNRWDECFDLTLYIFHLCQHLQIQSYFKKFFWIFLRILTSQKSIPTERYWQTYDIVYNPIEANSQDRDISYLLKQNIKRDPPEISLILHTIGLDETSVANIYIHGSYVQGRCTPESDIDMIIVKRGYQRQLLFHKDFDYFHRYELHRLFNKYDVCVYSTENFEKLLQKNYLLCVQCLFLPNEFKIKEEIDFRQIYLSKFYDSARLKTVAFYEHYYTLSLINSAIKSSYGTRRSTAPSGKLLDKYYLFKNLFHGIRYLGIAIELIETRSIHDFTRFVHIFNEMKDIWGESTNDSAMKQVTRYVREKGKELKSKLNVLIQTNIIEGDFEIHIQINSDIRPSELVHKLSERFYNTRIEITKVELSRHRITNSSQEYLFILKHHENYPSILRFVRQIKRNQLRNVRITGVKIKSLTSNENVPQTNITKQLLWNGNKYYFQFLYEIPSTNKVDIGWFEIIRQKCKWNSTSDTKYCASPYVIRRITQKVYDYIIELDVFNVGFSEAQSVNEEFKKHFERTGIQLATSHSYFVVYEKK